MATLVPERWQQGPSPFGMWGGGRYFSFGCLGRIDRRCGNTLRIRRHSRVLWILTRMAGKYFRRQYRHLGVPSGWVFNERLQHGRPVQLVPSDWPTPPTDLRVVS